MSSTSESLSNVLDVARESLVEGDYLKVASFLKTLLKEDDNVYSTKIIDLYILIEFESLTKKKTIIEINRGIYYVMKGSTPNRLTLSGSINNKPFTENEDDLIRKIYCMGVFFGYGKIKRTVFDVEEEWKNFTAFKKHAHEMDEYDNKCEDQEEDEDNHYLNTSDCWTIRKLLGVESFKLNHFH
jgi:hypothetical protein